MKNIVFDTGPIISLAMNNLLWILPILKKESLGEFYITDAIKKEAIDRPIKTKKFKLEGLRVLRQLKEGTFKIYSKDTLEGKTNDMLTLANSIFKAKGSYIQIVHYAEMEVIAAALDVGADAVVIDERTMRMLIENPLKVRDRLQRKLHTRVEINKENLTKIKDLIGKISVLRSFELATIAYEKGLLDGYLLDIENPKKELIEGILWGVKLAGCSVSEDEINHVLKMEKAI